MAFNQLQPRRNWAAFQSLLFDQFPSRHVFENIQNGVLINVTFGDLFYAMFAVLKHQIKRFNRIPEFLKIHWRKPIINVLYVLKFFHFSKISQTNSAVQILQQNGDGI